MKLNRNELRKIIYDFNSISNRLLQAAFEDYNGVLAKFIDYIKRTPIINDYVVDCGVCDQDLPNEFQEVSVSYGRCTFSLGDTDEEEVRNIFAILNYIIENKIQIHYAVALGYSSSNKYQDKIKGFNDRVTMVLIRHIERYLTKIGIDMGVDEKVTYSITVQNGQVNIANDNATINATNTNGIDFSQCSKLLEALRKSASNLAPDDKETLESSLEVIKEEVQTAQPRKSFLKTAIAGIKTIKGTTEFASAAVALFEFLQTYL